MTPELPSESSHELKALCSSCMALECEGRDKHKMNASTCWQHEPVTIADLRTALAEIARLREEMAEFRKAIAWIVECEEWDSGAALLNEQAMTQAKIELVRSSERRVSGDLPASIEEWMMLVARKQGRDESAAEIARLRAQVDAVVVVPELTKIEAESLENKAIDESIESFGGWDWSRLIMFGYNLAASRAHSAPSSRVLKDGEVAVDATKLETLIEESSTLLNCARMNHWKGPLVDDVGKALAALRSQEGGA